MICAHPVKNPELIYQCFDLQDRTSIAATTRRKIIRRSRQLSALKGHRILAQGKREAASAPPWVISYANKPVAAKPRESANLICGQVEKSLLT